MTVGAVVLVCCSAAGSDERVIDLLDIQQPRTFGYQIGDKFHRTIELQLRAPYRLARKSLPTAGRLTEWLASETPEVVEHTVAQATRYHIDLTYQVVNISPDETDIAVPHLDLLYSDGRETLKALVPATRITVTVLRRSDQQTLQPDQVPLPIVTRRWPLALYGSIVMVALSGLAWLQWGLPSRSHARPFRVACRQLRQLRGREWDEDSYHKALQAIHEAFNATAGKTLFADRLTAFFAEHRKFAALQRPISDFFMHSRQFFFNADGAAPALYYSQAELLAFAERCCDVECGLA